MRKACVQGHKFSCGVCWENGESHKLVGAEKEKEGTMGSHQEESPNSCTTTYPHTHVHKEMCNHIRTYVIPLLFVLSLCVTHTDSVFLVMHALVRTSEKGPAKQMLCHCLHKGTSEKKREKGDKLPPFFLESACRTTHDKCLFCVHLNPY